MHYFHVQIYKKCTHSDYLTTWYIFIYRQLVKNSQYPVASPLSAITLGKTLHKCRIFWYTWPHWRYPKTLVFHLSVPACSWAWFHYACSVGVILKLLSAIIARDICSNYCNYCKRIPQEKHLISRQVSGKKYQFVYILRDTNTCWPELQGLVSAGTRLSNKVED